MKGMKKWISLALSAGLMAGMLCTGALASEGPWGHGGSSSSVTPEDASQGTVAQVGDSVQVTLNDGTVATFTSAHLNGTITFTEFFSGEPVTLKVILVEPGCIVYSTSPSGNVYTSVDEVYAANDEGGAASVFCHHYDLMQDGRVEHNMNDMSLLGNAYVNFGPIPDWWADDYVTSLSSFFAEDGQYCPVTQEVLDQFCSHLGIEVEGAPAQDTEEETTQPSAQVFSDVPPDAWYAEYVQTVYEKGLFSGTGDGVFSPNANMTYAQFLVVLSQFSGEEIPASGGAWYQGYVDWAGEKGLIPSEIQDGFAPDAPITRQDMAALFGAFLNAYDHGDEAVNSGAGSFSDADGIADYAQEGVTLCWRLGIMGGNADGTFAPQATATRAQVAVTMVQMARVMGR